MIDFFISLWQFFTDSHNVTIEGVERALFAVLAVFLYINIRRYRLEVERRLQECEDAHLELNTIQIDALLLNAEMLTVLEKNTGSKRNKEIEKVRKFRARNIELVSQVRALNNTMLKRRADERKEEKVKWWRWKVTVKASDV